MSHYILKIFYVFSVIGFTGCSKFLEESDPSNISTESFYTLPEHAEAGIAAVYADTRFVAGRTAAFSANWQMLEALTGTSTTESAEVVSLNNLYALTHDGYNAHIVNWWNGVYKLIAQTNLVLEKVQNINPMDAEQKKRILGEAHFVRAWAYFFVVRLWGDAPLITTAQTAGSPDFYPSRSSQESIYDLILSDLETAEASGLPWMQTNGRVSLAAVKALLAKVHLTMAGFPLNKGTSSYALSAQKALEVIVYANSNPAQIDLFPNYAAFRDPSTKNRLEHLFMIQFNGNIAPNDQSLFLRPNFKPVSHITGVGTTIPTSSFYASFESDDLRAKNKEGFFYTSYYMNGFGAEFDLGAPYIYKFFNPIAYGTSGQPGNGVDNLNMHQIRYAEVLLIYAEAKNEVDGPGQEAYDAFKRIRNRAQLTTPLLSAYTQQSFREAIWRERWYELCFEGITWFDMVRLRKVFNESTLQFDDFVGHINRSSNQPLQEKHLLLPLPTQEMFDNPNLTPQNLGY